MTCFSLSQVDSPLSISGPEKWGISRSDARRRGWWWRFPVVSVALGLFFQASLTSVRSETYPVHPDAKKQPDVPAGKVIRARFDTSQIFPGTRRDYFVYVPAQYRADEPAALMVFQDGEKYVRPGSSWRLPTVFDNLIHRGEMPVTIAVCVNPGIVGGDPTTDLGPVGDPATIDAQHRFNRSFEYDTVSDRYGRFLIEELLPEVAKSYRITADPNLRGIGGSSSGAIAAFGAAWHHPDSFRRVFSTVGTFVGLRGGNEYPTMIRHAEPKPIRVFLQDGRNDLNIYGGDWWTANQTMLSALRWAGYDVKNQWGDGGHNGKHGAAIFPDAMRWLWADHDRPITVDVSEHPEVKKRLLPGQSWLSVSPGHESADALAVAPDGRVYFADTGAGEIWMTDAEEIAPRMVRKLAGVSRLAFDADGNLYCVRNSRKTVTRINIDGRTTEITLGVACDDILVVDHGLYLTDPQESAVWYVPIDRDGVPGDRVRVVGHASNRRPVSPAGLAVTPDRRFLQVVDAAGRYAWSYRIETDGGLRHGQPYFFVQSPRDAMTTGADGATMTADGQLLVATTDGIQAFDQPGRSHLTISRPAANGRLSDCVLAGPERDWLFVCCGREVFRRRTAMRGIAPWEEPVVPPKPRL